MFTCLVVHTTNVKKTDGKLLQMTNDKPATGKCNHGLVSSRQYHSVSKLSNRISWLKTTSPKRNKMADICHHVTRRLFIRAVRIEFFLPLEYSLHYKRTRCCCCLLQTTLSCQVTNTSIDFSVVSVVASGAQILSKNCKHLCDCR